MDPALPVRAFPFRLPIHKKFPTDYMYWYHTYLRYVCIPDLYPSSSCHRVARCACQGSPAGRTTLPIEVKV